MPAMRRLAGRSAAEVLPNAATPAGSASTPAPTIDFTRLKVETPIELSWPPPPLVSTAWRTASDRGVLTTDGAADGSEERPTALLKPPRGTIGAANPSVSLATPTICEFEAGGNDRSWCEDDESWGEYGVPCANETERGS